MDFATLLPLAIKASIFFMVLGLGMKADRHDALFLVRRPGLLARSLLAMNVMMPLLAAMLVLAFDLPDSMKIALVAITLSPVPPVLPNKQLKAGGHAQFAIGLLVAVAVLSIIVVPLGVSVFSAAFDRSGSIGPTAVAKVVLLTILVPLAAGMLVRSWWPGFASKAAHPLMVAAMLLLVVSALPLVYASWPEMHNLFGNGTVAILVAVAVIGLLIGHLLGGPVREDRTVLALSTASRHPAIALAVAISGGAEMKAELAAVLLYTLVAFIVSVPYVMWRKPQAPRPRSPEQVNDAVA